MTKISEKFWWWLAWNLPKKVVYFAFIRLWANATIGEYAKDGSIDISVDELLKRWEKS